VGGAARFVDGNEGLLAATASMNRGYGSMPRGAASMDYGYCMGFAPGLGLVIGESRPACQKKGGKSQPGEKSRFHN
jgi:hypothetical protein